ncbi:hypothetical protein ASG31_11740 [Chryseobacterium sp. Leaf404]|uniref:hypothetical protein n=1 Tax=unclassified Chryseobacterium TaxID=2593645 RepID=UPI0006F9F643|nr:MULTISPECIES: hypothetical protein [unclassified Chryseobacterium]KQT17027.1 hypothetical protein ASG31_11740 [Chryseobacterium sp. Leaf404]
MSAKLFTLMTAVLLFSCSAPSKDPDVQINNQEVKPSEEIEYRDYTDMMGEKLSVGTHKEDKAKTVKYNGSVYVLEKDFESNTYSTSDNEYQFTENNREVTFLKKNYNMVLFTSKKSAEPATAQMH